MAKGRTEMAEAHAWQKVGHTWPKGGPTYNDRPLMAFGKPRMVGGRAHIAKGTPEMAKSRLHMAKGKPRIAIEGPHMAKGRPHTAKALALGSGKTEESRPLIVRHTKHVGEQHVSNIAKAEGKHPTWRSFRRRPALWCCC